MEPAKAVSAAAALVSRVVAGDRQAETELVQRFSGGVLCLLRREVVERAAADDLHQEVFRIAIERIRGGQLREPDKLAAFICGLARNLAIEYFRDRKRRVRDEPIDGDAVIRNDTTNELDLLLAKESAQTVRAVLRELPTDRDRQILFRFYIAEERKDSICRDLGLTSLHFNRVLCRARDRFRELYEKRFS
jgi:RNA polymerase sigma-70 factor, ECF subfamily